MSKTKCIIAIDPGLSGAMCTYEFDKNEIKGLISMPVIKTIKGRSTNTNIDVAALTRYFKTSCENHEIVAIIIEQVHSSPQMGVASAFKFGEGFGITRALAQATGCRVVYVGPAVWKPKMLLTNDKKLSIEKARKIFGQSPWFTKSSKDGPAEAALLAVYAARQLDVTKEIDPLS